ncbi:MAG: hypothetical protein LBQ61_02585 [Spirochaetales bacterium]|jgi:hypothetical protein|nr:hypothetical protein [Spirochaetales bacterium]
MLRNRTLRLFLEAAGVFMVFGCGIPDYVYLEPPDISVSGNYGNSSVVFYNNTNNDPLFFKGYAVYYRFFLTTTALDSAVLSLTSAQGTSDLTRSGYQSLARISGPTGSFPVPLVPVVPGGNNQITLDFSGDLSNSSTAFDTRIYGPSITGISLPLGRYILQNRRDPNLTSSATRSFKPGAFYTDDSDIPLPPSQSPTEGVNTLYLSVFILSYGQDNNATPIYSRPVHLGRFEIPIPSGLNG